ncbi:MAG: hypothetical protein HGB03_01620 [Candidatus Yonathbacteria bacterium]|nr:hypothetical protein [Candidatus Yonathbacteria bacterium]NTW47962.1 hypothetical protein [Candidatus Yonathbacteria bacterium]
MKEKYILIVLCGIEQDSALISLFEKIFSGVSPHVISQRQGDFSEKTSSLILSAHPDVQEVHVFGRVEDFKNLIEIASTIGSQNNEIVISNAYAVENGTIEKSSIGIYAY